MHVNYIVRLFSRVNSANTVVSVSCFYFVLFPPPFPHFCVRFPVAITPNYSAFLQFLNILFRPLRHLPYLRPRPAPLTHQQLTLFLFPSSLCLSILHYSRPRGRSNGRWESKEPLRSAIRACTDVSTSWQGKASARIKNTIGGVRRCNWGG